MFCLISCEIEVGYINIRCVVLVAVSVIETACLDIALNGKHIALAEKLA